MYIYRERERKKNYHNEILAKKDKVLLPNALTFRLRNIQGHIGDWSSSP